jgi:hypothetical protein
MDWMKLFVNSKTVIGATVVFAGWALGQDPGALHLVPEWVTAWAEKAGALLGVVGLRDALGRIGR